MKVLRWNRAQIQEQNNEGCCFQKQGLSSKVVMRQSLREEREGAKWVWARRWFQTEAWSCPRTKTGKMGEESVCSRESRVCVWTMCVKFQKPSSVPVEWQEGRWSVWLAMWIWNPGFLPSCSAPSPVMPSLWNEAAFLYRCLVGAILKVHLQRMYFYFLNT